jgi:hypothetical protein
LVAGIKILHASAGWCTGAAQDFDDLAGKRLGKGHGHILGKVIKFSGFQVITL